jgi:DNA-binding NtrC family response regulator
MAFQSDSEHSILIVDDEPNAIDTFVFALEILGLSNIIKCLDETKVMNILGKENIDLVLLDIIMPRESGESLLEEITLKYPDIPVLMITGIGEVQTAVRCMRKGAFDYLTKPVDTDQFAISIKRAMNHRVMKRKENLLLHHILTESLRSPQSFSPIITQDRKMLSLFMYCEAVAHSDEPVMITGETGVGKELFAKAIHDASGVRGEFVAVNVAGVDDHAFSDTLFGHKKGAFTGAAESRKGLFEKAVGGTLFLDEIGDLSEVSQVKLLRVLQDHEYFPLGSDQPRQVGARVLVATNREPKQLGDGTVFRKDLYYRLRTHHIHIPPLRDRQSDIPLLLDHYLEEASHKLGKGEPTYPNELPQLLMAYDFPGNIRELRAMVYDGVSRHTSRVMSMNSFREHINEKRPLQPDLHRAQGRMFESFRMLPTLKDACRALSAEAMLRARGNRRIASAMLGITPSGLTKRLAEKVKD